MNQLAVVQGPRRRKKPVTLRTHEEIYDRVEDANQKADAALAAIAALGVIIGSSTEDHVTGSIVLTGLVGTVSRLSKEVHERFNRYDRWLAIGLGFVAAFVPLASVVWWLMGERLGHLLRN